MNDKSDAHAVQGKAERLQFLLAEYANVGQQHRDEIGRLIQSWVALAALVSVTTLFLASDFAASDVALLAPFGVVAWCQLELYIVGALLTRRSYLAYLERKANRLVEGTVWEFETRGAAFLAPIRSGTAIQPWLPNYAMLGLLLLGLYVGFGIIAWTQMTHGYTRATLVALMTVAAVAFAGVCWATFRAFVAWERSLIDEPEAPTG